MSSTKAKGLIGTHKIRKCRLYPSEHNVMAELEPNMDC
jgi:hypothetical protein